MTAIDNTGLLNMCNNCGAAGFVPAINYSFDPTGYTSAPTVSFSGGGGTGAAATATIVNGRVTAVNVTSGGTGYTSAPTVSFSGSGGATATATISGGAVTGVVVTNGGTANKVKLTDASAFGSGDNLHVINITVSDKHGNSKNAQITSAGGNVSIDLASGFNVVGGFNIAATIVSNKRVVADMSIYDVFSSTNNASSLGNTDIQGDVDGD